MTLAFNLRAIKGRGSLNGLQQQQHCDRQLSVKLKLDPPLTRFQPMLSARGQYHFSAKQIINQPFCSGTQSNGMTRHLGPR